MKEHLRHETPAPLELNLRFALFDGVKYAESGGLTVPSRTLNDKQLPIMSVRLQIEQGHPAERWHVIAPFGKRLSYPIGLEDIDFEARAEKIREYRQKIDFGQKGHFFLAVTAASADSLEYAAGKLRLKLYFPEDEDTLEGQPIHAPIKTPGRNMGEKLIYGEFYPVFPGPLGIPNPNEEQDIEMYMAEGLTLALPYSLRKLRKIDAEFIMHDDYAVLDSDLTHNARI